MMTTHPTVSRATWLEARLDLLAAEKDLTRQSDKVAQLRRQLPRVEDVKQYVFAAPGGRVAFADLFEDLHQLLVQHFMLAPGWKEGCPSCSYMADHVDGMTAHLARRDVAFLAISRAPCAEIEYFRRRMGWRFRWVSSYGTDFNYDFRVSFTPEEVASGRIDYNCGNWPHVGEEWPGVSVFYKDDVGHIFHTYSTYGRGVEVMKGAYRMLDLTPRGRAERDDTAYKMEWVRHHDCYDAEPAREAAPADAPCCRAHA